MYFYISFIFFLSLFLYISYKYRHFWHFSLDSLNSLFHYKQIPELGSNMFQKSNFWSTFSVTSNEFNNLNRELAYYIRILKSQSYRCKKSNFDHICKVIKRKKLGKSFFIYIYRICRSLKKKKFSLQCFWKKFFLIMILRFKIVIKLLHTLHR